MHQKHLLRFIKSKLRKEADEVVIFRDGKYLTLREVFESLKLTRRAVLRCALHGLPWTFFVGSTADKSL
jgi:AMP deaminase